MYFNREYLEKIQKVRLDVGENKNNDYSSTVDVISTTGIRGIAIRLFDKASRLLSLTDSGVDQKIKDESIRDTLLDAGNYADYGVALLDGEWGKEKVIAVVSDACLAKSSHLPESVRMVPLSDKFSIDGVLNTIDTPKITIDEDDGAY